MTAEPRTGARGGRITAPRTTRIDAFLLAAPTSGGTTADAVRRAVEYGVAAEAAGFDGAWFAEHHFVTYGCCPSAPALAAHLLGRTERITVGTAACVLSARHPVALAEEAVLLDAVSGGRFALGVARGGPWVDLEVFGTGLDRYRTGFAESLDLMTGWLSGVDSLGAAGRHFAFRPVSVVPQPEHPVPVYVAATSPSTVECAAARGLPLLLGMHATDAEKRALLDRYAAVAERHGHDPDVDHAAAFLAYQADTRAEAHRRLRAAMPARLAATTGYVRIDGSAPPITDHAAYLARLLATQPVGTAADVTERLAESVAATGIRRALLMVEGAGDPAATRETIAALGATLTPLSR